MAFQGDILKKHQHGDKLTDTEVKSGAEFYRRLAYMLVQCGPTFSQAHREANETANALEDIANARGLK